MSSAQYSADTKHSLSNGAIVVVIIVDDYYHALITTLVTFYFQKKKKVTSLIPCKLKKRIPDLFSHIGCCFILRPVFR